MDLPADVLISAVDETARMVLPPRQGDLPGAKRRPEAQILAERLYAVPGETWRAALDEWPSTSFFSSAVARRVLEAQAPTAGEHLKRSLINLESPEAWIYRAARDAAFPAAFALGYAYGREAARR